MSIKINNYFIGIMTGTSADAIDGCIVSFDNGFELVESASIELQSSYKKNYEECIKAGLRTTDKSKKLLQLENFLNDKTIELVKILINKSKIDTSKISSIAFSGQTIFHTNKISFQIGNPSYIANESLINVYSDFRNFDIKNGGIGAPLIPAFHSYLYSEKDKNKVVFNIGGIANGTYLKNGNIFLATDVGPGNCLIDYVMSERLNKPFDNEGIEASKGEVEEVFFQKLINSCSHMKYPRADDKQIYYDLIDSSFSEIELNSVIRTLTEFTAEKIKEFYVFCEEPEEVIIHGGGTKNIFLMRLIENKISANLKSTDEYIPSQFVEAAGFAYLAYLKRGEIFTF